MIGANFLKEWQIFRRDGRLVWISAALLAMLLFSTLSSWQQFLYRDGLVADAKQSERDRWVGQGEKNPHSAAHYGVYVFKPTTPLAVIDPGVSDYQGDVALLEAHKRNDLTFKPIEDAIELQRLGTLNPALVLQLLLPLFIVLTGFAFFAGEREQGTLRMLLLSGQSPASIFSQKAAVLFSISMVFLAPIVLYMGVVLATSGNVDGLRLLALLACYVVYILIWVLLTLIVSAFAKTSRQALVALLVLWAATSLIVPKLAMDLGTRAAPTIPAQEFYARMEYDLYTPERLQAIENFKQETLQAQGVASVDDLPFNWAGAELLFGERYSNMIFDRLFGLRNAALARQTSIYQLASVLSPFIGVQAISSGLSTTDWFHQHLFAEAAEKHRRMIQSVLNSNVRDHIDANHKGDADLWASIPDFTYTTPSLPKILPRYSVAMLVLVGWLLLAVVGSWLAARRLSVEGRG